MPTRNVNLTDHFDQFVNAEIQSGRYANASEVIRAGLNLLERAKQEDEAKLEALREAARIGLKDYEEGRYTSIGSKEELRAFFDNIRDRIGAPRRETSGRE